MKLSIIALVVIAASSSAFANASEASPKHIFGKTSIPHQVRSAKAGGSIFVDKHGKPVKHAIECSKATDCKSSSRSATL